MRKRAVVSDCCGEDIQRAPIVEMDFPPTSTDTRRRRSRRRGGHNPLDELLSRGGAPEQDIGL